MIVSIASCQTYEYKALETAIHKSFKAMGGIENHINRGDTVLLKANLLMKKKPEEATTTQSNDDSCSWGCFSILWC